MSAPTHSLSLVFRRLVFVMTFAWFALATQEVSFAGDSAVSCEAPFVFPNSAVNVIIAPYELIGADLRDPDLKKQANQFQRDLTRAVELGTTLMAKQGALGVITVEQPVTAEGGASNQQAAARGTCTADSILWNLLWRKDKYAARPGQAVIVLTGNVYQDGDEVLVQSKLRIARFVETPRGIAIDSSEAITVNFPDGAHSVVALIDAESLVFPPREITKSGLSRVKDAFRKAAEFRDSAHTPSFSDEQGPGLEGAAAFTVEEVDSGGWMKVQPFDASSLGVGGNSTLGAGGNMPPGSGWIKADSGSGSTQFLRHELPELEFLSGAIGYLRALQKLEGLEGLYGERLGLASVISSTSSAFANYAELEPQANVIGHAAAHRLWGIMFVRLAEKHAGNEKNRELDDWKQAAEHFRQAATYAPEDMKARSLLGVSQIALCCKVSGGLDVKDAVGVFSSLLSVRPNDLEALRNLASTYGYLEQEAATSSSARAEASRRYAEVNEVIRLVLDP